MSVNGAVKVAAGESGLDDMTQSSEGSLYMCPKLSKARESLYLIRLQC